MKLLTLQTITQDMNGENVYPGDVIAWVDFVGEPIFDNVNDLTQEYIDQIRSKAVKVG